MAIAPASPMTPAGGSPAALTSRPSGVFLGDFDDETEPANSRRQLERN